MVYTKLKLLEMIIDNLIEVEYLVDNLYSALREEVYNLPKVVTDQSMTLKYRKAIREVSKYRSQVRSVKRGFEVIGISGTDTLAELERVSGLAYVTKKEFVEAIQFTGKNDTECLEFCPVARDPADKKPNLIIQNGDGVDTLINQSDFIVFKEGFGYYRLTLPEFHHKFERSKNNEH